MPYHGTALARLPQFLLQQAEAFGLDRGLLMREVDLQPAELADPDSRVQVGKAVQLWRRVLAELPQDDLGIRLGSAMRARDAGLVGYTMMHSPNLGQALRRLVRFGRILDETFPPKLEVHADRVVYSVDPLPEQRLTLRRMADYDLAAHVTILREITDSELAPLEVHFPYRDPPSDLAPWRAFFRARLVFDRPTAALVLRRPQLELPVRTADEELGRYLDELARKVAETLVPSGSFSEKLERALWTEIKDGRPQLQRVAEVLAISPRTLQRRLREEGTTFAALLDGFRRRMAVALLEDRKLAVYEVAYLLGYSEPSTFHRAFRRWTGRSPKEFRTSAR